MDRPVQLAILSAGCQPWNFQVASASTKRFAYCATLSVYIFQEDNESGQYALHSIFSENKRGITSMCWHPTDSNLICTTSCDKAVIIWHIDQQKVIAQVRHSGERPVSCCFYSDYLVFATKSVAVNFWRYEQGCSVTTPREYNSSFSTEITIVKFCSHHTSGKALVGHIDGTVSLLVPGKKAQRNISLRDEDDDTDSDFESSVTDIQWDPHSTDYALVSRYQNRLVMIDVNSMMVLMRYILPSKAAYIQSVAWVPDASGVFVTGDQQSGILRVWNVSKAEPLESVKVKPTGFHAITALKKQKFTVVLKGATVELGEDSTAGTEAMSLHSNSKSCSLPPSYLVCTFLDGGVGLYDLELRKWAYLREQGHIETVFDCKFSTSSPNLLATASFDGSVKIWDTSKPELKFECSSPGNEGILYEISWSPSNLNCIAVASAKYGVFIWDVGRGRIAHRYHEHGKGICVYAVCWNHIDSTRILSGGADGFAITRQIDGSEVVKFHHGGAAVYGCEWSPSNQLLFATGAEDGKVRLFSHPVGGDLNKKDVAHQPVQIFQGHSSKSFNIRWSPLRDGYLASGSDDATIRIWSYGELKCTQVLRGHKSHVRGLCWSPEICYLLYSGSWDYTIVLWDIRSGSKLCILDDHSGDVYGLSIHKERPFILASSSRDSTVRLWSTYQVVSSLPISVLAQVPWTKVFATPQVAMAEDSIPLLCGKLSDKICKQMTSKTLTDSNSIINKFHTLFQYMLGVDNLLDLLKVVQGKADTSLSEDYGKGIVHIKHLTRYKQAEAIELDMARQTYIGGQIGAPSRQDKLQQAAELYLKLGNLEKYCLLLIENNQWEKSLSLAPAVSIKFWKSLLNKYTAYLISNEPSHALPFQTAKGQPENLVDYHASNGAHHDALVAAAVCLENTQSNQTDISSTHSAHGGGDDASQQQLSTEKRKLLKDTVQRLSEFYMSEGHPVLACCVYLSADMVQEGVASLIKSHTAELAFSLARTLQCPHEFVAAAAKILVYRCDRSNRCMLAYEVLKSIPKQETLLTQLCLWNSHVQGPHELRRSAGIPSMKECDQLLKSSADSLPVKEQVRLHLLSSNQSEGLELALRVLIDMLKESTFSITPDLIDILQYTQSVQSHVLIKHPVILFDLLTISCYIGALRAIYQGYDAIVKHLMESSIHRMKSDRSSSLPLSVNQMTKELYAWNRRDSEVDSSELKALYTRAQLTKEVRSHPLYGPLVTPGSTLPSYSNKHKKSIITHNFIKGPVYHLEDGESVMSLSEALMWAHVNPFSPISCSQTIAVANKINPM